MSSLHSPPFLEGARAYNPSFGKTLSELRNEQLPQDADTKLFDRDDVARAGPLRRLSCHRLVDACFGSIAPGQHTAKQSLGNGQIPLAALRGRADLLESPWAMTAFGSSSHWYL